MVSYLAGRIHFLQITKEATRSIITRPIEVTFASIIIAITGFFVARIVLALKVFWGSEFFGSRFVFLQSCLFCAKPPAESFGLVAGIEVGLVSDEGAIIGDGVSSLSKLGSDFAIVAATTLSAPSLFVEGYLTSSHFTVATLSLALAEEQQGRPSRSKKQPLTGENYHESLYSTISLP